ncbi:MFS transporter [Streptomyces roseoverticillatus]|uniref:MFS transporter n=1 Tax=Streptomyces roseoverticillatus TaxID=66429 RepID=UPI0033F84522
MTQLGLEEQDAADKQQGPKPIYDGERLLMGKHQVILVSLACLTSLLLALLDINIVSAVSWKMVGDLDPVHGISRLPWLTTCYALADCIVVPLYGKLADVHGPKPVFLFSLGTFLIGSCLCGVAQDMTQLIVFRTVQGIGAGGLTAVALIIMGVLFRSDKDDLEGATSSKTAFGAVMFGVGLALGPTLGGLVSDSLNWRWVFYINVPLGLLAFAVIATMLRLPAQTRRRKVDFLGAALIAGAAASALLIADWGGKRYAWDSTVIILLAVAGVVLLAGFIRRITTAREPLISLALLRNPMFRIMMPISLIGGLALAGGLFYVGGYAQIGRGLSPTRAGLLTLCMACGLIFSALVGRWIIRLFGKFKYLLTASGIIQSAVLFCFSGLGDHTSFVLIGAGMAVIGVALGQTLGLALLFTQNNVELDDIGIATTSLRFSQQLGTAFGFAFFSTVVTRFLAAHLTGRAGAANVNGELDTGVLATLTPDQHQAAVHTFIQATNWVFLISAFLVLIPSVLSLFIKERSQAEMAAARS